MKKILRRVMLLGMIAVLAAGIAGCAKFDPVAYTKACMDAMYKREYKEYAKQIDVSEDEAKKDLEAKFEKNVLTGFDNFAMSEGDQDRYLDLMEKLYSQVKYEVGKAEKKGDGYTVEITVEPIDALKTYSDGLQDKIQAGIEDGSLTEDNIVSMACDYMEECIDNASFGEKEVLEVEIIKDSDGLWQFPDAEIEKVGEALFQI